MEPLDETKTENSAKPVDATDEALSHIFAAVGAMSKLPPSRELSLAKTKIEEAEMWLQRADVA